MIRMSFENTYAERVDTSVDAILKEKYIEY